MINRTRLSLVSAAVLVAGPALNAAAQTVSLGRAAIAAPSMVMGLNSTVQSATPGLTPMVMPSLLAATIIPSAPALVVARAEITPTAQLTTIPQGLNLDKPGAVQELSAHLNSMYEDALAPDGGSSGNVWTTDMLNAFVNDHGTALRAVPGVLNAVVAPSLARKPASLTIFVDSSVELATVKKAVEKAVPDIERLYGIMGAPNQVLYSQIDPAYSHLTLTNIMPLFQDGGAIVLEGNLSKSVKATIRMDLALNSQTYGQFFVVEKTWNLPTPAERKMTASELNGLGWTVAKHLINTPDDPFRVLYLKLLAAISSPEKSGNVWTVDMLRDYLNENGNALRAVPGVLDVVVAPPSLGRKLAFLSITLDSTMDMAQVKKAIEKAVPSIVRLYGLMGAPNQVDYWWEGPSILES